MARGVAILAAIAVSLLAVSGAGGAGAQTPKRGGTVVVASSASEPACLNPFDESCAPGSSQITVLRIYNRVLEAPFDVGPRFTWRKQLVSDVEFTTTAPYTLTYHIKPQARWSDGVRITAADFVFTHNALRQHGPADNLNRTEVRSVRALDPKTVRVVLRTRLSGWRGLFGPILPKHALRQEDLPTVWKDGIVNPKTGEPIGSGPFLTGTWARGTQIVLRQNPRYWGAHRSYVDRVVLRFAASGETLASDFRSGKVDVAASFPPSFFRELDGQPGVRTVTIDGTNMEHLAFRMGPGGHQALRSKLVRRAIAFGVDRRALADVAFGDLAPRPAKRDSIVLPTYSRYYRANWAQYRYRPAEARALLERAGCTRGTDGIYSCAGQRLSLTLVAPFITGGFRPRIVELAQKQFRQVGVEVMPQYGSNQVVFGQILPSGAFDVALFNWTQSDPDPTWTRVFGCGGPLNFTGYCQRLVTADLDQADHILDAERRAAVLNRADVRMAKDVSAIPLFEQRQWAAVSDDLRGFAPTALDPLVDAENWWLER